MKAFEIVYADGSVVPGTTKKAFQKAPEDDIQFVIVRETDGSITINKAADTYEFRGATKRGSWTDPENYERLKASLRSISKLLVSQDRDLKDIRLSEIRKRSRSSRE